MIIYEYGGDTMKELVPVLLSYGCVIVGVICLILDIVRGNTNEMIFFLHILMTLCWSIVSIKWTREYKNKINENTDRTE